MIDFHVQNFTSNNQINPKFICTKHGGKNEFPTIFWKNKNKYNQYYSFYSLIMEDPDAPSGTFVHWYIPYIPNNLQKIDSKTIQNVFIGYNSLKERNYFGPCNPEKKVHHYIFYFYIIQGNINTLPKYLKKNFISTKNSKQFEDFIKEQNMILLDKIEKCYNYQYKFN
jgi:phosphatidylethanolamine-binding protein (PEBP) family uncharacterized protein